MTKVAHMRSRIGAAATVVAGGSTWHVIDTLFPSTVVAGGQFAFYVAGNVGGFAWTGSQISATRIEVALAEILADGSIGTISLTDFHACRVGDGRLRTITTPGAGWPFGFLCIVSSSAAHPEFGSSFASGRGLALVARILTGGDPGPSSAQVTDWWAIAFDLTAIASGSRCVGVVDPASKPAFGVPSGAPLEEWGTVALPSSSGQWLVFWSVVSMSSGSGFAPTVELYSKLTATGGTPTNLQDSCAMDGRPPLSPAGSRTRVAAGGFRVLEGSIDSATVLGWKCADRYTAGGSNPAFQTAFWRGNYFAVETSALYSFLFRQDDDSNGAPIVFGNLSDAADIVYPLEPTFTAPTSFVVLAQTRIRQIGGVILPRHYRPQVSGDFLTPIFGRCALSPQWAIALERVPFALAGEWTGVGVGRGEARYEFACLSPVTIGTSPLQRSAHMTVLGFGLDDDPGNGDPPAVIVGTELQIIPGREAPDPGTLPVVPLEPNAGYTETGTDTETRMRVETGHAHSWPLWTRGRRTFSLQWSGLTAAQRDALLAVLIPNAAVAWRPKTEPAALAFRVVERPRASNVAKLYTVSATLLELVWTE